MVASIITWRRAACCTLPRKARRLSCWRAVARTISTPLSRLIMTSGLWQARAAASPPQPRVPDSARMLTRLASSAAQKSLLARVSICVTEVLPLPLLPFCPAVPVVAICVLVATVPRMSRLILT